MTREPDDNATPDPPARPRFPYGPAAVAAAAMLFAAFLCVRPQTIIELTSGGLAAMQSYGNLEERYAGRLARVRGVPERFSLHEDAGVRLAYLSIPGERMFFEEAVVILPLDAPEPPAGETVFEGRLVEVNEMDLGFVFALLALDTRRGGPDAPAVAGLAVAGGALAMFAWTLVAWRRARRATASAAGP